MYSLQPSSLECAYDHQDYMPVSHLSSKSKKEQRSRMSRRKRRFCAHCGTPQNLTIDHIIPLAKGGKNTLDNLQMLCYACNTEKADSHPYVVTEILEKVSTSTKGKGE
jgi:5-methylcytosine-specific restriction endonuclease McrA